MSTPPSTSPPVSTAARNRNRLLLVLIFVIFLGSAAGAVLLRLSGWQPQGMGNHGELLDPPGDLRLLVPELADGSTYPWEPSARLWRIVVAPPAGCGPPCTALAEDLGRVRQLLGHKSGQVHLLWVGAAPAAVRAADWRIMHDAPELRAGLPRADDPAGIPVYVIDPNGFVILRYAPGFDPARLRDDMNKLLKLR